MVLKIKFAIAFLKEEEDMSRSSIWITSAFLLILVLALLATPGFTQSKPKASSQAATPGHVIAVSNFAFSPAVDTVAVAATVTWRNDDDTPHTVTSDAGKELNSPEFAKGKTYAHSFKKPGQYPYHCTVHSTMQGVVVVK